MWPIRSLIKWFYPGFDFQLHTESLFAKSWFVLVFVLIINYVITVLPVIRMELPDIYLDENKNSQIFYEMTERVMRRHQID